MRKAHDSDTIYKFQVNILVIKRLSWYLNKDLIASGMRVVINATQPKGQRVDSIQILCAECTPIEYKPIDLDRVYRVITTDFLANGGNRYTMFPKHSQNYAWVLAMNECEYLYKNNTLMFDSFHIWIRRMGELDIDALTNYVKSIGRIEKVETGRITVLA